MTNRIGVGTVFRPHFIGGRAPFGTSRPTFSALVRPVLLAGKRSWHRTVPLPAQDVDSPRSSTQFDAGSPSTTAEFIATNAKPSRSPSAAMTGKYCTARTAVGAAKTLAMSNVSRAAGKTSPRHWASTPNVNSTQGNARY